MTQYLDLKEFRLPIEFNPNVKPLDESLIQDLELTQLLTQGDCESDSDSKDKNDDTDNAKTKPTSNDEKPMYKHVFSPCTDVGKEIMTRIACQTTDDIVFLKEMQKMAKKMGREPFSTDAATDEAIKAMSQTWSAIKGETSFCEKYAFIQWDFAKFLNEVPLFLQLMSLYNIASPLISLCSPLLILIVPFFVLKMKNIPVSFAEYGVILKEALSSNPVAMVFTQFGRMEPGKKLYAIISAGFYLFTIYQNILSCIQFYCNMRDIHAHLNVIVDFLNATVQKMRWLSSLISSASASASASASSTSNFKFVRLRDFKKQLDERILELHAWQLELQEVSTFSFSFAKIKQFGRVLSCFYDIYVSDRISQLVSFAFGFHGFMENMEGLVGRVKEGKIHWAMFSTDTKDDTKKKEGEKKGAKEKIKNKTKFYGLFYPKFLEVEPDSVVKNNCSLSHNIIITAPNGGGKTTMLKSVLINTLLAQQVGAGCFDSRTIIVPYSHFHCYLNIPDTSGRDSLFQAEARRCKEILDKMDKNGDKNGNGNGNGDGAEQTDKHLCIFDELYSGTNPEEAVESATSFLKYLSKKPNVSYILTTHYVELCRNLEKNKKIVNMHMGIANANVDANAGQKKTNDFSYTFLLKKGISTVKGGRKVLRDLNYPAEMLS